MFRIEDDISKLENTINKNINRQKMYFTSLSERFIYKKNKLCDFIHKIYINNDYNLIDDYSNNMNDIFERSSTYIFISVFKDNTFKLTFNNCDESENEKYNIAIISNNEEKLLNEYLYCFLKFNLNYYNVQNIDNIVIQIPVIEDQKKIIEYIKLLEEINEKNRELINFNKYIIEKIKYDIHN